MRCQGDLCVPLSLMPLDPAVKLIAAEANGPDIVMRVAIDAASRWNGLPGVELVRRGLEDLDRGVESHEALLVSIGAARLRALGLLRRDPIPDPEHRLYDLLAREDAASAHSRYNGLVRRLVSFERAAECVR